MSADCFEVIDRALSRPSSTLSQALRVLGERSAGRGTCLVLEHDVHGETLIADRAWSHGRAETLRKVGDFALVELCQEAGFRRLAVLVQPTGDEEQLDDAGLALTMAALDVTAALADITSQYIVPERDPTGSHRDVGTLPPRVA